MKHPHFVFCAVYPVVANELHDAVEVIVWPPEDDTQIDPVDEIASAQHNLANAVGLARIFVVRAPDDRAGSDFLDEYFSQFDVEPFQLVVLDLDINPDLTNPLSDAPANSTCAYHLPWLFLMRDIENDTVESLLDFCFETLDRSDGDSAS